MTLIIVSVVIRGATWFGHFWWITNWCSVQHNLAWLRWTGDSEFPFMSRAPLDVKSSKAINLLRTTWIALKILRELWPLQGKGSNRLDLSIKRFYWTTKPVGRRVWRCRSEMCGSESRIHAALKLDPEQRTSLRNFRFSRLLWPFLAGSELAFRFR